MTTNKDTDLREALRRKYADTPQMPADLSERLMKRLETTRETPKRRYWPYITAAMAIAASILLLIVLYPGQGSTEQPPVVAKKTAVSVDSVIPKHEASSPTKIIEQTVVAQAIPDKLQTGKAIAREPQKPKADSASAAENLADCIARLEAEMENIDDSVRDARLEKLIAADARLQQMVNRIAGKQVEQAMNELQKDSTANYINF
jgi:anti-sigma-K factor RskA